MSRILFWTIAIIAATVVFVGLPSATSLRNTIATTGGSTIGLIVGGVPTFVASFKDGMAGGNKATNPGAGFQTPPTPDTKPAPAQTRRQGQRAGRNG